MTSVSQFAQYLLKLDPQRNPARLTLYNFIKHVLEPNLPLTPAVIQNFYARALHFEQWQNDSQHLGEVVRSDLIGYLKKHALEGELEAWKTLRHADTLQVVPLKVFQDVQDLLENEHQARLKTGDQLRYIKLSESQTMALLLSPSGNLEVKVYPHMAIVWGCHLRLMSPISQLYYSPELELAPHVRQVLEGSVLTTHCFHVDVDGVHGLITRGATFQKFETFIRAKMSETQDLFYSLKRLERHFVNPRSDPHYREIINRLERANRMLENPTVEHISEAERALSRGRLALKNIFPNDKLLSHLIHHVENGLISRQPPHSTEQIPR